MLLQRIVYVAFREHPFHWLYLRYTVIFSRCPFRIIHLDIVTWLVLLVALVHLLRPSIAKRFEENESDESITRPHEDRSGRLVARHPSGLSAILNNKVSKKVSKCSW